MRTNHQQSLRNARVTILGKLNQEALPIYHPDDFEIYVEASKQLEEDGSSSSDEEEGGEEKKSDIGASKDSDVNLELDRPKSNKSNLSAKLRHHLSNPLEGAKHLKETICKTSISYNYIK